MRERLAAEEQARREVAARAEAERKANDAAREREQTEKKLKREIELRAAAEAEAIRLAEERGARASGARAGAAQHRG